MMQSRAFVCVLSKNGIKQRFENLTPDSRVDNVLLEHRMSLELKSRGFLEGIYPLFVGEVDSTSGNYGDYFSQGCHPNANLAVVDSVEEKLVLHLENQGLGLPLLSAQSVKVILDAIVTHQGGFVKGSSDIDEILVPLANKIANMCQTSNSSTVDAAAAAAAAGGGGSEEADLAHVRAQLAERDREVEELHLRLKELTSKK